MYQWGSRRGCFCLLAEKYQPKPPPLPHGTRSAILMQFKQTRPGGRFNLETNPQLIMRAPWGRIPVKYLFS